MRILEWVQVIGVSGLLVWWAMGRRVARAVPIGLVIVMIAHLFFERQRATMWPIYLIEVIAMLAVLRPDRPTAPVGRWRLIGRWTVALLLLTLVVPLPWLLPVITLPTPTGPFGVGTSWLVVTDSSRTERFSPTPTVRTFPVRVWYPVAVGAEGKTAPYGTPAELTMGALPALMFDQIRLVKTHSVAEAPIVAGSERFPPLIFSHGYGGSIGQNTPQMEELASRGYVVLSIGHTGEAGATPFPGGRVVPFDSGLGRLLRAQATGDAAAKGAAQMAAFEGAKTVDDRTRAFQGLIDGTPEPLRSVSVVEWAADTKALADRLELMNQGTVSSPFVGRLDLDKLGVFGMSYGGATAGEFCRIDRRCKAGLNIDGGQFGDFINDSLTVPFFILASEQAYLVHTAVLDRLKGPAYLVRVPKTNHIGLTDMSLIAPVLFRWGGITGKLDPDRRERIMTEYVVAFFDSYLKGRHSALLDGPSKTDPDVSFVTRNP